MIAVHSLPRLWATLFAACLLTPANAQIMEIWKELRQGNSSSKSASAAADGAAERAEPVKKPAWLESELAPDVQCKRPRERFNFADKLSDYGGTAATLRLQRLVSSDYKYSDLTPEDTAMLRYLAQTTMWVPPDVEVKLAAAYDISSGLFGRRGSKPTELEAAAIADIELRLDKLRGVVPEYPTEIRLSVDKRLADGAFARLGGLILLSERFLNGLTDAGTGADFLLAHEVSHVYKRHVLKDIQFKLISSAEGWDLGKKVLQRASRGLDVNAISDGIFLVRTVPQLVEFTRGTQLSFNVDQELEADACSTVWLKAIGSDPIEAWDRYHVTLGANTSYSEEHPTTEVRERRFKGKALGIDTAADKRTPTKGTVTQEGNKILNGAKKK